MAKSGGKSVTLQIAAPSSESAAALVSVLATCGLPSEQTRLQGRKVELVCPEETELENRLADIVSAVQLWLHGDASLPSAEIKGGGNAVLVTRSDSSGIDSG